MGLCDNKIVYCSQTVQWSGQKWHTQDVLDMNVTT